jgi:hypothetical protein
VAARRLAVALLLLYAKLVGGEALLAPLVFPLLALEEAAKAAAEEKEKARRTQQLLGSGGRRPLGGGRRCALLRLWRLRRKTERWRRA